MFGELLVWMFDELLVWMFDELLVWMFDELLVMWGSVLGTCSEPSPPLRVASPVPGRGGGPASRRRGHCG